jgi:hypothetical protein
MISFVVLAVRQQRVRLRPFHNHPEYELNLVAGISGTRIVGDSTERYSEFDMVLLARSCITKWMRMRPCWRTAIPVVTIQFGMDLFNAHLMKERFYKVRKLLTDSVRGIKFSHKTIGEAIPVLLSLTQDKGFVNVIEFFTLLDMLSKAEERSLLASEGFTPHAVKTDNHRMQTAYAYILKEFCQPEHQDWRSGILVNMSESVFSHFFQKNTNKSFTQFLIDVRIGHACKLLLDGDKTIRSDLLQFRL